MTDPLDPTDKLTHIHVRLTFPQGSATEPVIYEIVKRFDVVPNIRRAAIHDHTGWMVLDLSGARGDLDRAIAYLTGLGVDVARVEGDILEG